MEDDATAKRRRHAGGNIAGGAGSDHQRLPPPAVMPTTHSSPASARHLPAIRLAALLLPLVLLPPARPAAAADYVVDPAHTYASFEIDHLGFSTQRGRFDRTSGRIAFDPATRQGELEIRIAAASLDTGLAERDDILRGTDWFNVVDFPDILFRSRSLLFSGEQLQAVEGTLILRGEMRPLRLQITRFKCGFNLARRQTGCGADAEGTLRRSDFGLANGLPFVGDEVRLRIQVEAYPP